MKKVVRNEYAGKAAPKIAIHLCLLTIIQYLPI